VLARRPVWFAYQPGRRNTVPANARKKDRQNVMRVTARLFPLS